jgi:hypothetical protein
VLQLKTLRKPLNLSQDGQEFLDSVHQIQDALPQIQVGNVKAIAVSGSRSPLLADVPTAAEQGLAGLVISDWYGLLKAVDDQLHVDLPHRRNKSTPA